MRRRTFLVAGGVAASASLPSFEKAEGPGLATPDVPAQLVPFLPKGASWVRSKHLDDTLVRADWAELYFDLASDTVYVRAGNLRDPNKSYVQLRSDGTETTVTPSPVPVPS